MVTKNRKAKNSKNFVAIPFNISIGLGTLGDDVVIFGGGITPTLIRGLFVISIDGYWALRGLTAGEGPIQVGYSHNDLTVAEVAEKLDVVLPDPGDIIERERSRRPVRNAGMFPGILANEVLADGRAVRTKIKFSVGETHALNSFVRNLSGSALTTGAVVDVVGTVYARWI